MDRVNVEQLRNRWPARRLARAAERCGAWLQAEGKITLARRAGARLRFGDWIYLFPDVQLHLIGEGAAIEIGDRTYINRREIVAREEVEIGADCAISGDVVITDSDEHWQDGVEMVQPVRIGDVVREEVEWS